MEESRSGLPHHGPWSFMVQIYSSRRIYIEENAKVVAAAWGTEFIQFLAELAILHQDDLKNRIILS